MGAADYLQQPFLLQDTRGPGAVPALVLCRGRHPDGVADRLDAKAAAVPINGPAHLGWPSSSSFTKKARSPEDLIRATQLSRFTLQRADLHSWTSPDPVDSVIFPRFSGVGFLESGGVVGVEK